MFRSSRPTKVVVLPALVVSAVVSSGCNQFAVLTLVLSLLFAPWQETQYSAYATVEYYAAESYGTAPAVVKMWTKYYTNGTTSQSDISGYLAGQGATGGEYPDTTQAQLESALQNYSSVGEWYQYSSGYCNGGRTCAEQILADIHLALENGRPPATIWHDYAMIVATGGIFNCTLATGCRPSEEILQVHLPAPNYGEDYYVTTGYYINNILAGGSVPRNLFYASSDDYMATDGDAWAAWDYYSGTYYGDPDPPDPMCPSFAEYCEEGGGGEDPPDPLMMVGAPGSKKSKVEAHGVVFPEAKTREEIIANFVAGVNHTKLNTKRGLKSASLEDGLLVVGDMVNVRSLVPGVADYFLLYLHDRTTDALYARAAVSEKGLLMSIALNTSPGRTFEGAVADAQRVAETGGKRAIRAPEPVFFEGRGTLPELDPSFVVDFGRGERVIVTARGIVYDRVTTARIESARMSTSQSGPPSK